MITCKFENNDNALLRHVTVDCLVLREGKILLAKRSDQLLEGNKWSLIGGFVERDESLIQAAEREIMEETGWKSKNIKLLRIKDSPNRPKEDRQNISFVYICDAVEKIGEKDAESNATEWFDLTNLPHKEDFAFDHFDDIEFYLSGSRKP
jgi:ADP-ribose pyrophosphatase YjhB (NUDIX family)